MKLNENFEFLISYLSSHPSPISYQELLTKSKQKGMTEAYVINLIEFFNHAFDLSIRLKRAQDDLFIMYDSNIFHTPSSLSLNQWFENLRALENFDSEIIISEIDKVIESRSFVNINTSNESFNVIVHKVLETKSGKSLLAENLDQGFLFEIKLRDIKKMNVDDHKKVDSHFNLFDIKRFEQSLHEIESEQVRLVLKIKQLSNFKTESFYQNFGRPYVTSNGDGDIIWAADVNADEQLFEWLSRWGDEIEIIDPLYIKMDYQQYLTGVRKSAC